MNVEFVIDIAITVSRLSLHMFVQHYLLMLKYLKKKLPPQQYLQGQATSLQCWQSNKHKLCTSFKYKCAQSP